MASDLPLGWEDRTNRMSEHDIALGGVAATKFRSTNAYDNAPIGTYQSSDQVRAHYLQQMELAAKHQQQEQIQEHQHEQEEEEEEDPSKTVPQPQQHPPAASSSWHVSILGACSFGSFLEPFGIDNAI
jgi:hypothetical protein